EQGVLVRCRQLEWNLDDLLQIAAPIFWGAASDRRLECGRDHVRIKCEKVSNVLESRCQFDQTNHRPNLSSIEPVHIVDADTRPHSGFLDASFNALSKRLQ